MEVQKIPQMRVQEIHQQPSWKILGTHYAVLVEKAGHFLVKALFRGRRFIDVNTTASKN